MALGLDIKLLVYCIASTTVISIIMLLIFMGTNFAILTPIVAGFIIGYFLTKDNKNAAIYSFLSNFIIWTVIVPIIANLETILFPLGILILVALILAMIQGLLSIIGAVLGNFLKSKKKGTETNIANSRGMDKIYCSDCGTENDSNYNFCRKCGKNL